MNVGTLEVWNSSKKTASFGKFVLLPRKRQIENNNSRRFHISEPPSTTRKEETNNVVAEEANVLGVMIGQKRHKVDPKSIVLIHDRSPTAVN